MNDSGYSQTTLARKLGIKVNFTIRLINAPQYYLSLFSDFPADVSIVTDEESKKDLIHYFETKAGMLEKELISLKTQITPNGMIWVSWHKKSAKIPTDITEDIIRDIALRIGLVDIKVCAIDAIWSGLKLVIPVKDRGNPHSSISYIR
jgi:hypothetical protein